MSFRIARPTARLEEIKHFYEEIMGFDLRSSFSDHSGFSGFIFGLPDSELELEFIKREKGQKLPPPTEEHLLVWYIDNPLEWEKEVRRLEELGLEEVQPGNPWWEGRARTYKDPDGWRIVISKRV